MQRGLQVSAQSCGAETHLDSAKNNFLLPIIFLLHTRPLQHKKSTEKHITHANTMQNTIHTLRLTKTANPTCVYSKPPSSP